MRQVRHHISYNKVVFPEAFESKIRKMFMMYTMLLHVLGLIGCEIWFIHYKEK